MEMGKKFSDEIADVFKKASVLCKAYKMDYINIEAFIYEMFKKYVFYDADVEHAPLEDIVKNMPKSLAIDTLDCLKNAFEDSTRLDIEGTAPMIEGMLLSPKLSRVISGLLTFPLRTDSINIFDLLPILLSDSDCESVRALSQAGIDFTTLVSKSDDDRTLDGMMSGLFAAMGIKNSEAMDSDSDDSMFGDRKVVGGTLEDLFNGKLPDGFSKRKKTKKEVAAAEKAFEAAGKSGAVSGIKADPESNTPNLDQFAVNMNLKALSKKGYDPVIGRDNEVKEIIRILSCRLCNNPMLLGDPGCGKTAIVEHLAGLIANGDPCIPESLKNKKIFNLDVNAVVAGCIYRGQFEERMQNIIKEVVAAENIIIYIDEIHNMVGAGAGQQDRGDMANILKPFLSRGEFQCIGSTTTGEFRKVIEKDKALVRRFETLFIGEPNIEDTVEIIKGLTSKYEEYHKVKYTPEAIRACVEAADRYIYGSFFPAKAVKVLDKAGADVKIARPRDLSAIINLEEEIDRLEKMKIALLDDPSAWDQASDTKDKIDDLKKDLVKLKEKSGKDKSSWPKITVEDVYKVISSSTGIPVDKIKSTDMDKIREMKGQLDSKVIGQAEAIEEMSLALQQNMLGLRDPKKPIASFLFVGPTGVGKTLISKTVAEQFFGSDKNLVTIACSEYMQDWAESKLLGCAPGYVGFDSSEPRLYILKRQPYTVLLIDEIEKSSNNLYNIWLNMLEEGEVTLSSGEKISCRNCIIIFTGNVGTKSLETKGAGIGYGAPKGEEKKKADTATIMKEVEKEFRPEFLNRLSKIVVFNSLEKDDLAKIFDLEFGKLHDLILKGSKLEVKVSDKIKDMIISKCEPKYGARSLKRLINEYIQKEICKKMLSESTKGKSTVTVDVIDDEKVKVEFSK